MMFWIQGDFNLYLIKMNFKGITGKIDQSEIFERYLFEKEEFD